MNNILKVFDFEFLDWDKGPDDTWADRVCVKTDAVVGFALNSDNETWEVYCFLTKKFFDSQEIEKILLNIPPNKPEEVKIAIDDYLIRLFNLSLFI